MIQKNYLQKAWSQNKNQTLCSSLQRESGYQKLINVLEQKNDKEWRT